MSPKKKVKVEAAVVGGQMQPLATIATKVNEAYYFALQGALKAYYVALQGALNIIFNRWPIVKTVE